MFISVRKTKNKKEVKKVYYLFYKHPITQVWTKVSTKIEVGSPNEKIRLKEFKDNYRQKAVTNADYSEDHSHAVSFEFFKETILDHVYNNSRYRNYQIYMRILDRFQDLTGNKKLKDISVQDIENYKQNRMQKVKGISLHMELRTLKAAFNIAIELYEDSLGKYIPKNPVKKQTMISIDKRDRRKAVVLSKLDETRLMRIMNDDFREMVTVAIKAGLRPAELVNLKWCNVDFEKKYLYIREDYEEKARIKELNKELSLLSKEKRPKRLEAFELKSEESERDIPMHEEIYRILLKRQERLKNIRNINGYVFPNKNGMKRDRDYINDTLKEYCKQLGLNKDLHLYSLRHTFGTRLKEGGHDTRDIQKLMGHSSIVTTVENYLHEDMETKRSAVNCV
ncbi:MAG: site-specific integrase [Ignavibacteria bacterium]|nr:site-specific integrase [Ignavibacteria bacterium]